LRYYGITEALALDLAGPTRRMLEQLRTWLTLTEPEREQRIHVPVLKDRGWRLE
jgi:hypothetical protein